MSERPSGPMPYTDAELDLIGKPGGPELTAERLIATVKSLRAARERDRFIARRAASRLASIFASGELESREELDRLIEHFGTG